MNKLSTNPIATLTTFTITAPDASTVIADNKDTAHVVIHIYAVDAQGNKVQITEDDLNPLFNFGLYTNDSSDPTIETGLPWKSTGGGWCYTDTPDTPWSAPAGIVKSSSNDDPSNPDSFDYYIYTDQMDTKDIWAEVTLNNNKYSTKTQTPPSQVTITGVTTSAPVTGVSIFYIQCDNLATNSVNIFGNGNMQARIRIGILAHDADGNKVPMTDTALTNLSLVNYNNPSESIPWESDSGWSWTDKDSGFAKTMPSSQLHATASRITPPATNHTQLHPTNVNDKDTNPDIFTYFVSTTITDTKSLAAQITLNGTTYYTYKTSPLNYVEPPYITVNSAASITYDDSNTQTSDTVFMGMQQDLDDPNYQYTQRNFYFSITTQPYYIFNVIISSGDSDLVPTLPTDINTPWSGLADGGHENFLWIWEYVPNQKLQTATVNPYQPDENPHAVEIIGNDRQHQLCISLIDGPDPSESSDFCSEVRVTIYDQFGNSGYFSVVRDEDTHGTNVKLMAGEHTSKHY